MLVVGRAVAGLGSAGLQNGALTIISSIVPLEKRACEFSHACSGNMPRPWVVVILANPKRLTVLTGTLMGSKARPCHVHHK